MAKTFIIIDGLNTFFRAVNTVSPAYGVDAQGGLALHTLISSMNKCWKQFSGSHLVLCTEGRSWRKSHYPDYKANRVVANLKKTQEERENDQILIEMFNDFCSFAQEKTNMTYLQCPVAEADDLIATWIQSHPEDNHVVISSDSDFVQLLSHPNVKIYDPINDRVLSQKEIINSKGKKVSFEVLSNGKIKLGDPDNNFVPEHSNWYELALFIKIVRGDTGDNIMAALPGARFKGTKNKIGILDAFLDRNNKGYNWNNFLLQRYIDHQGNEVVVKDLIERNQLLIDLTMQPEDIRERCLETIALGTDREPVRDIGFHFMKFCAKWDLKKISDNASFYVSMLQSKYGEINDTVEANN